MKIALVNNYYYLRGGSERVLFDDQAALTTLGHEVEAFSQFDAQNEHAAYAEYFPRIQHYLNLKGVALAKAAVNVVYSNEVGSAFARFLNDFRPDIIHCHNIYGQLTTAVLDEAKRRDIPAVMTVHDLKLVCPSYLGSRQGKPCLLCSDGGYWRCLRYKCHKQSFAGSLVYTAEAYFNRLGGKYDTITHFLCPSRFMRNALQASGIAEERTLYHPNALDPELYAPRFEPGEYVLYAGRLSGEKGIMTLLEALRAANIPLRIAGTGPLEGEIQAWIKAHDSVVEMEGFCTGVRLAELFRNSAFTVVPSEWYENASMSILESFAYGKPVLASDIGGNPELVLDGETGRLFPSGSVEALAKIACEIWQDRRSLDVMGRRARCVIEGKYSQKQRVTDLISIYNSIRTTNEDSPTKHGR